MKRRWFNLLLGGTGGVLFLLRIGHWAGKLRWERLDHLLWHMAAALILWEAWRRWVPEGSRRRRPATAVLWMWVAAVGWQLHVLSPHHLRNASFRRTSLYHYALGAKYFRELGYDGLYRQTLAADREGAGRLHRIGSLRDPLTLEPLAVDTQAIARAPGFSPERWAQFRSDVDWFTDYVEPGLWHSIFMDRGYNATPFATVVFSAPLRLLDFREDGQRALLVGLDVLIPAITTAVIAWVYGPAAAAWGALLLLLYPGHLHRITGGYLTWDWLGAFLGGLALYRRGRHFSAGIAMAYAGLSRLFPLVLVGGWAIAATARAFRERAIDPADRRFGLGFLIALSVGLGWSLIFFGGLEAWSACLHKLVLHARRLEEATAVIGWPVLAGNSGWRWPVAAVLIGGSLAGAARAHGGHSIIAMLPALFALSAMHHYYGGIFAAALLWEGGRSHRVPHPGGWVAGLSVCAAWALAFRLHWGGTAGAWMNAVLLAAALVGALSGWAALRRFRPPSR